MYLTKYKEHSGVIFGLFLGEQAAQQLYQLVQAAGVPGAEPPEDYHITLAYLGDAAMLDGYKGAIQGMAEEWTAQYGSIIGTISGVGRFNNDEGDGTNALYASFDSASLSGFRSALVDALGLTTGVEAANKHGFTPHITLAYIPADGPLPPLVLPPIELTFNDLTLAWGDARQVFHLSKGAMVTVEKAANYSARAGQTIAGRLVRGNDGKFSSGGDGADIEAESKRIVEENAQRQASQPKKGSSRRGASRRSTSGRKPPAPKKPAAPKKTEQERQTEVDAKRAARTEQRTAEQATKLAANRSAVLDGLKGQIQEDTYGALLAFNEGGADVETDQLAELARQGLVEQDKAGQYRMTEAGRNFAAAADRGDVRDAKDALSRGQDRVKGSAEQAARATERAAAMAKRRAEVEARRAAPKASGGGGGSRAAAPKPASVPGFSTELSSAASKLSTGTVLSRPEQRLLIRNGLARRDGKGLVLTAAGLRASKQTTAKAVMVYKDASGAPRWLAVTTTSFQDRDREIISQAALEQDVERTYKTGNHGPLRFWHVPGLDIGDCDYRCVVGKSLIESGTFRKPEHAALLRPGDQMSPGFVHPFTQPRRGIYHDIAIFERSAVPAGRASNPFTRIITKEYSMLTDEKIKEWEARGGDPAILAALVRAQTIVEKGAEASGVAFKELSPLEALTAKLKELSDELAALKAAPPMDEEPAVPAVVVAEVAEVEEPAESADPFFGDLTLAEASAFIDARLAAAIGPLLNSKLEGSIGEPKTMLSGAQTTKDAALAEQAAKLAALEATLAMTTKELADLKDDAPSRRGSGYRATQDPATALPFTPEQLAAFKATQQQPQDNPATFFGSLAAAANGNGQ